MFVASGIVYLSRTDKKMHPKNKQTTVYINQFLHAHLFLNSDDQIHLVTFLVGWPVARRFFMNIVTVLSPPFYGVKITS